MDLIIRPPYFSPQDSAPSDHLPVNLAAVSGLRERKLKKESNEHGQESEHCKEFNRDDFVYVPSP